jgi:hypothetical protein
MNRTRWSLEFLNIDLPRQALAMHLQWLKARTPTLLPQRPTTEKEEDVNEAQKNLLRRNRQPQ